MNNEVSKKQFIIITIVVIIITFAIVATILKNRSTGDIDDNPSVAPSLPIQASVSNVTPSNVILPQEDVENEIEDNNVEVPINTNNITAELSTLQADIETLTDKSNNKIFKDMVTPTEKEIKNYMNIDTLLLDEYIIRIDQNKFSSKMYMILKPYESGKTEVISQIKQYLASYSAAWSELNVEQYQIIQDKSAIERNGYLIYIISTDNDTVLNRIRQTI